MRSSSWLLYPAFALATACGTSGERAEAPASDTSIASAAPASGPAAIVTVLYNAPGDTAAFERYYAETHLPLADGFDALVGAETK